MSGRKIVWNTIPTLRYELAKELGEELDFSSTFKGFVDPTHVYCVRFRDYPETPLGLLNFKDCPRIEVTGWNHYLTGKVNNPREFYSEETLKKYEEIGYDYELYDQFRNRLTRALERINVRTGSELYAEIIPYGVRPDGPIAYEIRIYDEGEAGYSSPEDLWLFLAPKMSKRKELGGEKTD